MVDVEVSHESERGCGYRKPSKSGVGIYLVGPSFSEPCGRLPFHLHVCPTCSGGIKFSRSFTWINAKELLASAPECVQPSARFTADDALVRAGLVEIPGEGGVCPQCPMGSAAPEKAGLLWVGEKFYPTPAAFLEESSRMGVSKKIPAIPKGFEVGKTMIYLAHKKAVEFEDGTKGPGVFSAFTPQGVDLVIKDENDIPDRVVNLAEKLGDKGRVIKVVPKGEPE